MVQSDLARGILSLTQRHNAERLQEQHLTTAAMSLLCEDSQGVIRINGTYAGARPLQTLIFEAPEETHRARSRSSEPHRGGMYADSSTANNAHAAGRRHFRARIDEAPKESHRERSRGCEPHRGNTYDNKNTAQNIHAAGSSHKPREGTRRDVHSLTPLPRKYRDYRASERKGADLHGAMRKQSQASRFDGKKSPPRRVLSAPKRKSASPHNEARPRRVLSAPKRKSASPRDAAHGRSRAAEINTKTASPQLARAVDEKDEQMPHADELRRRRKDKESRGGTRSASSRSRSKGFDRTFSSSNRNSHRKSQGIVEQQ